MQQLATNQSSGLKTSNKGSCCQLGLGSRVEAWSCSQWRAQPLLEIQSHQQIRWGDLNHILQPQTPLALDSWVQKPEHKWTLSDTVPRGQPPGARWEKDQERIWVVEGQQNNQHGGDASALWTTYIIDSRLFSNQTLMQPHVDCKFRSRVLSICCA